MHFYEETKDGIKPQHFVKQKSNPNKTRPSRISDAKNAAKEGRIWYPSVTGILDVLNKPALINWKVDEHLKTVLKPELVSYVMANHETKTVPEMIKHIKALTEERLDSAPKAGTDIHNLLEKYLFTGMYPDFLIHAKIVKNVEECLMSHLREQECRTLEKEKYFINKQLGYAGQMDLSNPSWVIDYKSKQTKEKFKPGKMVYDDHRRQLAAYMFGDQDVERNCANIFICLETGEIDFHLHEPSDIAKAFEDFVDCLNIYHRNVYNPFNV